MSAVVLTRSSLAYVRHTDIVKNLTANFQSKDYVNLEQPCAAYSALWSLFFQRGPESGPPSSLVGIKERHNVLQQIPMAHHTLILR